MKSIEGQRHPDAAPTASASIPTRRAPSAVAQAVHDAIKPYLN